MLPELDMFNPNSKQLVHPEWITLHHKNLLFMSSEDRVKVLVNNIAINNKNKQHFIITVSNKKHVVYFLLSCDRL